MASAIRLKPLQQVERIPKGFLSLGLIVIVLQSILAVGKNHGLIGRSSINGHAWCAFHCQIWLWEGKLSKHRRTNMKGKLHHAAWLHKSLPCPISPFWSKIHPTTGIWEAPNKSALFVLWRVTGPSFHHFSVTGLLASRPAFLEIPGHSQAFGGFQVLRPPLGSLGPRTHVRVPHLGPLGKAGKWHRHGSENETGWLEYREKIKLGHFLSMSLYILYLTHFCLSWTNQSWGYQDWNWWVVATKSTAAGKPVCELFWSFKSSALHLRCIIWPYKPKTTALILTTSLRPCFLGSSAPFQWHWTSGNINS